MKDEYRFCVRSKPKLGSYASHLLRKPVRYNESLELSFSTRMDESIPHQDRRESREEENLDRLKFWIEFENGNSSGES